MKTPQYKTTRPWGKRLFLLCLLTTLSCMLNACMKKPVFINIASVKIGQLKDSTLSTVINFKVYNPNGISSTLTASNIKTYYKNKLVGNSSITNNITLPAHDTVIIPLASKINLWALANVFPELLASDSATFRIQGDNKVKAFGVSWNVPINDNIKLNVKLAIVQELNNTFKSDTNFKIKELRLSKLPGLNKTDFKMVVRVKNSFPFDYRLLGLNLDVYHKQGGKAVANWKLTDTIEQKAGATSDIPIAIEVDNFNVLSEASLSDVLHPSLTLLLEGQAKISIQGRQFTIPIEETRKVSFNPISGINL